MADLALAQTFLLWFPQHQAVKPSSLTSPPSATPFSPPHPRLWSQRPSDLAAQGEVPKDTSPSSSPREGD